MNFNLKVKNKERRKSQRIKTSLDIKYRLSGKSKVYKKVRVQDLSGGGLCIGVDSPILKGRRLELQIFFPGQAKPVNAVSKIVWCKEITKKKVQSYLVGIQHAKIAVKDRERFVFLFCETMLNSLLAKDYNE